MSAARRGAGGEDDLAQFGLPPEQLDELRDGGAAFEVWEENWPSVQLFLACQTQWRAGPVKVIGLDYAGVEVVIARRSLEVTPEVFEGLQVMEFAVLEAWNSAEH